MYDMAPTILISIIAVVLIIITIGGNLMVSIIVDLLKTYHRLKAPYRMLLSLTINTALLLLNKMNIKEYY